MAIMNDAGEEKSVYFGNGYKYKHEMPSKEHGNS
jgi:hypothetical protein